MRLHMCQCWMHGLQRWLLPPCALRCRLRQHVRGRRSRQHGTMLPAIHWLLLLIILLLKVLLLVMLIVLLLGCIARCKQVGRI